MGKSAKTHKTLAQAILNLNKITAVAPCRTCRIVIKYRLIAVACARQYRLRIELSRIQPCNKWPFRITSRVKSTTCKTCLMVMINSKLRVNNSTMDKSRLAFRSMLDPKMNVRTKTSAAVPDRNLKTGASFQMVQILMELCKTIKTNRIPTSLRKTRLKMSPGMKVETMILGILKPTRPLMTMSLMTMTLKIRMAQTMTLRTT